MRVRIVSSESLNSWILGKFARKLEEELLRLDVLVDIGEPDPHADINHYIIYISYNHNHRAANDTLMITHIDDMYKFNLLKNQMQYAKLGICMSRDTMLQLINAGIPVDKLAYINPAHDNAIAPKRLSLGITSRVYPDGCKREDFLLKMCESITHPELFQIKVMGEGWDELVEKIRNMGIEVIYYSDFDYNKYIELVRSLDYYLYLGMDEGSMGFLDALCAGVKTIVTAQGFHLDAKNGITHSFTELNELVSIIKKIEKDQFDLINSVSGWTWSDYAIKHYQLWKYILNEGGKISESKKNYEDGLNSLLHKTHSSLRDRGLVKAKLFFLSFKKAIITIKKISSVREFFQKVKKRIF
jgi:hypothetical protein